MKALFLFVISSLLFCCTGKSQNQEQPLPVQAPQQETEHVAIPYDSLRKVMLNRRAVYSAAYNQAKTDSAKKEVIRQSKEYLLSMLTDTVFPYWYGTQWAFSGITEQPGEGYIACGYFVSTTLKHSGFKLNRYKLAQQAASLICKSVSGPGKTYTLRTIADVEKHMKNQPEGLYVLGLDYHVGFLLKEKGSLYFIHSNYLKPMKVTREGFSGSGAVKLSDIFVVGEILTEDNILKWLKQEVVVVQTK